MITANDITSRCPVSERPAYLVFERIIPIPGMMDQTPFWSVTALTNDEEGAIDWANAENERDVFVCAMSYAEASNIKHNHLTFTDAEVAIYRSPYATAAE
ncbi:hypothetical protein [uncultured Ruegeria sp.]|uniref:hypothetical protein n=1 Tax=uncultured Ruegeria sp. TaxID=259304 RepID=UPI00262E2B0A|nr:hypothetical protein [uncultured Ruegeria sp.]